LNFKDLKNWPSGNQDIEIELKVFLKNSKEKLILDKTHSRSFDHKLDGFLGISPCLNESYADYSFYDQLSKQLNQSISSLTWNVSSTDLFDASNQKAGKLLINDESVVVNETTFNFNSSINVGEMNRKLNNTLID